MPKSDPFPPQLRLRLPSDSPVPLEGATRNQIVLLLAQLLGTAIAGASGAPPEVADEAR